MGRYWRWRPRHYSLHFLQKRKNHLHVFQDFSYQRGLGFMAPNEHAASTPMTEEYEPLQDPGNSGNIKPQILTSEQYSLLLEPKKQRYYKTRAISRQVGDLWGHVSSATLFFLFLASSPLPGTFSPPTMHVRDTWRHWRSWHCGVGSVDAHQGVEPWINSVFYLIIFLTSHIHLNVAILLRSFKLFYFFTDSNGCSLSVRNPS